MAAPEIGEKRVLREAIHLGLCHGSHRFRSGPRSAGRITRLQLVGCPGDPRLATEGGSEKGRYGRVADFLNSPPYITGAKKTVDIVSPYFVPGDRATEALCKLSQDGVEVRILTNSLASNDVSAVHAGYSKYRRTLLRCGVRLFELDESLKDREGKMFTWLPGLAKSSLHAKTMVFDGEIMFVGSFNFDQRSLFINNEIGPGSSMIRPMAGASAKHFEDNVHKVAFEVSFSSETGREDMKWTGGQADPTW